MAAATVQEIMLSGCVHYDVLFKAEMSMHFSI
jgi:hypothetical protein